MCLEKVINDVAVESHSLNFLMAKEVTPWNLVFLMIGNSVILQLFLEVGMCSPQNPKGRT